MNLPPDKVKLLLQYDSEKKWELICDQVCTSPTHAFLMLMFSIRDVPW